MTKSAIVLINQDAGAVLEAEPTVFSNRIIRGFAQCGYAASVSFVPGDELAANFQRLATGSGPLIVIAGGDGSVNAVLPRAVASRALFAILPLGTLNLIGQDLGLTGDLENDIAAIAEGNDMACDVVMANDKPFHSNAGLGFFVTMAVERQVARSHFPFSKKLGFAWAALKTFFTNNKVEIMYETDGGMSVIVADAVLVTNNRFFGTPWRRNSLQDGVLEMHTLKAPSLLQRLKVLIAVARGNWRELDNLTTISAQSITIKRRRRKTMRVALDGEIIILENPLRFTVIPGALQIRSGFPRSTPAIALR